jgi:hypothetical protein
MNPIKITARPASLLAVAALLLAGLLTQPLHAGIYKWTDASGEVHYTQTPPPGNTSAEKIEGAPPPPDPAAVHKEQQQLQERVDAMDERLKAEKEADAIKKEHEEVAKIDEKNCITARNNLGKLQQGGIKRYLTPEGEVIRLTDDERERRINEANSQIEMYCSP